MYACLFVIYKIISLWYNVIKGGEKKMPKEYKMIGKRFNRLIVIEELSSRSKDGDKVYKCQCDCGNYVCVIGKSLRNGNTKSCGCLRNEKLKSRVTTHGKSNTKMYAVWCSMKARCYNNNDKYYKSYGERGVVVCGEWLNDFMNFYEWSMNNGYKDNLTIDRIDVNGNYEPDNCRWVTMKEQNNNKRNNLYITYNGKTQTAKQWSDTLGIKSGTIRMRHHRGWSDKECLLGREV